MTWFLRKILPEVLSPKLDEDDEDSTEYSSALDYSGPLVSYDSPRASPIVVDQISIAVTVASPSLLNDRSLPVIQPIAKRTAVDRRQSKEPDLGSETTLCNNSLTDSNVSLNGPNVSRESQTLIDSSSEVGCATGDVSQPKSVNGVISSRKFKCPDCQDNSSDGSKEDADINHGNWESTGSGFSSHAHSSKVFSCKEEYSNGEETPCNVRGLSVITFDDPETNDMVHEESDYSESIHVRPKAEKHGKKVSCCQCLQENRSTEVEFYTVCGSVYCCNCVLRAMGSTSEGRKCVACFGSRLNMCMSMSADGLGSSGKLNSHNFRDRLSVSDELPDDTNEVANAGFWVYMNPAKLESTESLETSEVFSCREEDFNKEEALCHVKKPSVVTFCDPEPSDSVSEESYYSEVESIHERRKAVRQGKKGSCYRCLKGNRFTEKEVCIVCGAKFCSYCVLRAMGSMLEGRKCITCIGFCIDESKRETLGKCSRMLKRLLTEMEVRQIMRSEISCKANQLPPEHVFVNGEALSQKELVMLQSCPNPPKKLTPGNYWYDKVSGFWGKTGHGPCQIISPQVDVGGHIMKNASNGNTNVFINNREITKRELRMLQLAGVQCEGRPHFWVNADGSYTEEGMKNVKGCIWDKSRTKLVCAVLSLPTPPDSKNSCGDEGNDVNNYEKKILCKLLLLGEQKSGTSTIFKQAKLLFKVPFSEEERQTIKYVIQRNLYCYIGYLLESRERFEDESLSRKGKRQVIEEPGPSGQFDDKMMYSISPKLKAFSDWLLKVMASGNLEAIIPAATREYAPFIEELWGDAGFRAMYYRRNELDMLPRHATYFLERAVDISKADYEPSELDILYAEGITPTNGLSCMEYSFIEPTPETYIASSNHNDPLISYQLIRVRPRRLGENSKLLEMFEDVEMVLYCVSLTDYDEYFEDSKGFLMNKMLASRQLFENVVIHPTFSQKNFLLLLNKYDMLEEKIEQVPLSRCEWFPDFDPVISHNDHDNGRRHDNASLAQYAAHYIAVKFKRLFDSLTGRKLYVSIVTALEPDPVAEALRYAKEILKWEEEEPFYTDFDSTDYECDSTDSEAVDISNTDYEPSDVDVLYGEGITPTEGLSCTEYSFIEPSPATSSASSNQSFIRVY